MKIEHILILLICGLGVFHGFILGIYLLIKNKPKRLSNSILGILLLLFGLRISKSIFLYFTNDLDFILITLGLTLILILGPLFLYYTKSYLDDNFKLDQKLILHSLPFVVLLVLNSFGLLSREFYISFGVFAIYIHFFTYIVISFIWKRNFIQKDGSVSEIKQKWATYTHIGIVFIWISYFVFLIDDFIPYILGPLTYSVAIYSLSLWAILNKALKEEERKYQGSSLDTEKSSELFKTLQSHLSSKRAYLNPNLKLQMVASDLNVTPHTLSQAVNENCNQNFQNLLNSYRIKEAKAKLIQEKNKNLTISAIAYDCGFNSISAFNTAFKKIENQTPSQFRKSLEG